MAVRIEIFSKPGEGSSAAVMSQIRSLVSEMRVDASIHLITDEVLQAMNGVEKTPAVFIDGVMISNGWAPSRMEIWRALEKRQDALHSNPGKYS